LRRVCATLTRMSIDLGGTGIWSGSLRHGDPGEAAEVAAELEQLGYSALWIGDIGGDLWGSVANLLGATEHVAVATGIANIWLRTPEETAQQHAALNAEHGHRFLLGVGVSHAHLINRVAGVEYRRPLERLTWFLDGLDAAETPVPVDERVVAALGPKALAIVAERTGGTHPYLTTPEHSATARAALGDGAIVAPEQGLILETDPDRARSIGREFLARYIEAPNYTNSWRRLGFTDDDLADGGSDRLVDALLAWGDEDALAARVKAHRDAGASHVCVQVLTDQLPAFPLDEWRRLAPVLTA
jgi:probable F420-dependent oxidoreductase